MPNVKAGRPKKAERSVSLRVPESFVGMVRRLALEDRRDAGDWLAHQFGPDVRRRHAALVRRLAEEPRD